MIITGIRHKRIKEKWFVYTEKKRMLKSIQDWNQFYDNYIVNPKSCTCYITVYKKNTVYENVHSL